MMIFLIEKFQICRKMRLLKEIHIYIIHLDLPVIIFLYVLFFSLFHTQTHTHPLKREIKQNLSLSFYLSCTSNFFFFLAMPHSLWDLTSITRGQTCAPGIKPVPPALEAWSLNHWRAKKVPTSNFLNNNGKLFKIFKSNVTDLPLLDPVENLFFRIKVFVLVFGSFTLKLYTSTPLSIRRGQYNGHKHPISFLCFTREERKVLSHKMTSQFSSVQSLSRARLFVTP